MKKILLAGSIVCLCAQAYADNGRSRYMGCADSDLNGDWVGFQAEVLKNPHTGMCNFTVANGMISEGSCDFSLKDDAGNELSDLRFDGTATVNADCSATLTMDFRPYGRPFVSEFEIQLTRDKQSYAGRWQNTFGALGPTNGVKKIRRNGNFTPNTAPHPLLQDPLPPLPLQGR